ncbi:MAG: hypothetical protein OEY52_10205 [Gammaproteobacteria bacterium]|nr:hypothetical protein [Gammaproteobacteria bacterium]
MNRILLISQKCHRHIFVICLLASALTACGGSDSGGSSVAQENTGAMTVKITSPESGKSISENEPVSFVGEAKHAKDGKLSGDALIWSSDRDGDLGTGNNITVEGLSAGGHNIKLTATASDGDSNYDIVFMWAEKSDSTKEKRVGETNPYAGKIQRLPIQGDDELITIRRKVSDHSMEFGWIKKPVSTYDDGPSSEPVAPEITASVSDRIPVVADTGRISGKPVRDMALITRPASGGTQYLLEILSLFEAGQHVLASYPFNLPIANSDIAIHVADLDIFNETQDPKSESQYYDEVVVAYPEMIEGERRATVKVLSFESAEFADMREGATPSVVSERTITTTQAMHPSSKLILRSGEEVTWRVRGPHLVVSYLNTAGAIVVDVFRYVHSRDNWDESDPVTDSREIEFIVHQAVSNPLPATTVVAGGWNLVLGYGGEIGADSPLSGTDIIFPMWHAGGRFYQDAWKLEDRDSFNNPLSVDGPKNFLFARTPFPAISFEILPDSKLEVVVGRISHDEHMGVNNENTFTPAECEITGFIVLADTNYGPVAQSMRAIIPDFLEMSQPLLFGPAVLQPDWWPGYTREDFRKETTTLSQTSITSGAFTSYRNGLWLERGTRTAELPCNNGSNGSRQGPMPSFYVAHPELDQLHAVTVFDGLTSRGALFSTGPLLSSPGDSVLLLSGDADGDAAYRRSPTVCINGNAPSNCRPIYLGDAELHYAIEDMETSNVILQQPPKHIDYLPKLGGMTNVSMVDDFFAEFSQLDSNNGSITHKAKSDWMLGSKASGDVGTVDPFTAGTGFSLSLDAEHKTVADSFKGSTVTVSLQQTTAAIGDDVVWGKLQTIDFWRFPAQGGKTLDNSADTRFAENAYFEIAIPDKPVTLIGPGTLNESYNPTHHIGNILSYPTFSKDVTDLGELFGLLGGYVPTDEFGNKQCDSFENIDFVGCLVNVNENPAAAPILETVDTVSSAIEEAGRLYGGEFNRITAPIDVAEVLQVGGTSYRAQLEFSEETRRGSSVTNTDSINGEFTEKLALDLKGTRVPVKVGYEQQLRAAAGFEIASISENTLSSQTRVALNIPGGLPTQRSYQIRPSFGFTVGGSLNLTYQVNTAGLTESFWSQHYTRPDPALNMPFRIVRGDPGAGSTSNEFVLGTDLTRNRIKSFFVRDGSNVDPLNPADKVGFELAKVPLEGDPVQLEVRVTNLSVGTAVSNLVVEFSAKEYVNGEPTGQEAPIGGTVIPYLPHRGQFDEDANAHVKSAYVYWDTKGFGPQPGSAMKTWMVYVTLDPADAIPNETHELLDRYSDPLKGPTGEVLDPKLEKAQNNRGWSMVRIAPALEIEPSMTSSSVKKTAFKMGATPVKPTQEKPVALVAGYAKETEKLRDRLAGDTENTDFASLEGKLGETVELTVGLQASSLVRDYGTLRVFNGDPSSGGSLLLSKHVQGISASEASFENFTWRPESSGMSVLYVVYSGGGVDQPLVTPVPIRVR